jgi:hypothetical protein
VEIEFEPNSGRMVIPFLPSLKATSSCEEMGRPFVEATREQWMDSLETSTLGDDLSARLSEPQLGIVLNEFDAEVDLAKKRFESLASWINQLLERKRAAAAVQV